MTHKTYLKNKLIAITSDTITFYICNKQKVDMISLLSYDAVQATCGEGENVHVAAVLAWREESCRSYAKVYCARCRGKVMNRSSGIPPNENE